MSQVNQQLTRIFVGYDSNEDDAFQVLKFSLKKYASIPIEVIKLSKQFVYEQTGFNRAVDPLQSTEFTYLRFMVPYLCNYRGRAIFMDCDMLCLSDIKEIVDLDMLHCALRVVKQKHDVEEGLTKMDNKVQTSYPRKNWSSFMFLNCQELKCWTPEIVETASGARLHRFEDIPDVMIDNLPLGWNTLDSAVYMKDDEGFLPSKLIHYTSGGPWHQNHIFCKGSELWYRHFYEMIKEREKN